VLLNLHDSGRQKLSWHHGGMCRSIKVLRSPVTSDVDDDDIMAAALQYVRKVSGFRKPAEHNRVAFTEAVEAVAEATKELLSRLEIRGAKAPAELAA
jgi:hypothetical protein